MTLTHPVKIDLLSLGQHNTLEDSDFLGINQKINFEKESLSKYLYYLFGGRLLRRNTPRSKPSQKLYKHHYQAVVEFIECQKTLDEVRLLASYRFLDISKESKLQVLEQTSVFRSTNLHKSNSSQIEKTFLELVNQWHRETNHMSLMNDIVLNSAYQRIIGMGLSVVPLILKELKHEPDHWFWALRSITGANPVKPEDKGRLKKMAEAWLDWGRQHGYEC